MKHGKIGDGFLFRIAPILVEFEIELPETRYSLVMQD
jgi:hypothetical protein